MRLAEDIRNITGDRTLPETTRWTVDVLFDSSLITFGDDGNVLFSEALSSVHRMPVPERGDRPACRARNPRPISPVIGERMASQLHELNRKGRKTVRPP